MASHVHKDAAMIMTLLVLAGFVAVGITVMLLLAKALLQTASVATSGLEAKADPRLTHRAA
jgi:hypothetical protein